MSIESEQRYQYRPDGNFMIRCTCPHCGEQWDAQAMSQYQRYCDACTQVAKWEREVDGPVQ